MFRSFSKAWGLAGLRIGYAIGGPGSEELLAELEPDLGVSELSQAGALEALRSCSELVDRRTCARSATERPRLTAALRERGFEVADSQANFLWAAHPSLNGGELAARLARAGVLVAAGDALGEPRHVRIASALARGLRPPARTRIEKSALAPHGARRGSAGRAGLAQQRAGGALEDLAPGADVLLGLAVEVLHHLAHALAGDLEPVALGDLAVALVLAGELLGRPTRSRGGRSPRAR